ncbi:alpha-amylase family protein [Geobacter argillaceus]|uniref:Alpha-amylase n=1 Tax=Geobacter argillaceus TaxID=345631 RepID=A0A562VJS6_9BACT|nr:alpha-amylase family protein [Geobacter argillaceus]TWJ18236.1 alpha-amylase [Geobacter argillaceus]
MADVILHAFNWRYTDIADRAADIAARGYGGVLVPPPLYSDENGPAWWQRYQPRDYRVIRSHLGTKPELEQAINALHGHGVRVHADIVFNHMANEKGQRPDPYAFPGEAALARYRSERAAFERDRLYGDLDFGLFSHWDFNPEGDIRNWNDLHESNEHWLNGLPDLDLNPWVVEQQRLCLRALNKLGFDGYRIDAIKHLPEEHLRSVFGTDDMAGKYIFGEALTSNDREEDIFLWPLVNRTGISFYDFPLHETLRRAFAPGGSMRELVDPAAYGQALPWRRALTFSVTHDIPNNDAFRWQLLDGQDEYLANAYILGRDGGVPLVFSDHDESPGDRGRWYEAWQRYDIVQMIGFHNAVHGSRQRSLYEAEGFLVFARGYGGMVAINKTGEWQHPRINTDGMRQGRYCCQIHQHDMRVSGEQFEFAIPPRQAQMWLWQEG